MEANLFLSNLPNGVSAADSIERRLLAEYGSVFVARNVQPPTAIVFQNESEVNKLQFGLRTSSEIIGGFQIELQATAMDDLRNALRDAEKAGLAITPRGSDSAKRTYSETVELWASRVEPALDHWVKLERLSVLRAQEIRAMSPFEQVSVILSLEEQGIFFAKDLSKSVLYSVAPPGTSQHLAMLALDVAEHDNTEVRSILAGHKWYQTVISDLPHFTYLGVVENELPGLGLRKTTDGGRTFWIPDI